MSVSRRTVLSAGAFAAVAAVGSPMANGKPPLSTVRFSLKYAPHEGSFQSRGNVIEQIASAADEGFTAWEDNEAATRTVATQAAMARALQQRSMTMGVFVASMPRWNDFRPLLGGDDDADRERFLVDIRNSVAVAKRLNAKHMTIVPGFLSRKLPAEVQTARVIDVLRRAAEICEPHGLVMVMEPLNTLVDHPGVFMSTVAQGYAVAKAVNSPAIKVLADLYHQQIQAGNLINTLAACWDEIAYIQFGDNPGRKEPGTGEINYRNIVDWLRAKEFSGLIGMEHGNLVNGRTGEERLVAAYREIDRV